MSCLGRVFNSKLGCFCSEFNSMAQTSTPTSRVENSAHVASCQLKLVHSPPDIIICEQSYVPFTRAQGAQQDVWLVFGVNYKICN